MKKYKRTIAAITAVMMFYGNFPISEHAVIIESFRAFAEDLQDLEYTVDEATFIYSKHDDSIIIEGYLGNDSFVTIPESIEGLPVKEINFGRRPNGEKDDSDIILSLTLPDTVERMYNRVNNFNNLLEIRGSIAGHAMDIAKEYGISFVDINADEPYEYLKYTENEDNIIITGIDFSPCVSDYTIPWMINGKQVTELCIPSGYYYDNPNAYIPSQFTLKIFNPDILITDSRFLDMWSHCSVLYAIPGSTMQSVAYNLGINYVPIEETQMDAESSYTFSYNVVTGDEYNNYEDYVEIHGITGDYASNVVIPETINGHPVKYLRIDNMSIKNITIPDSVQYIDAYDASRDICFYVNNGSYAYNYAVERNISYKLNSIPFEYETFTYENGELHTLVHVNNHEDLDEVIIPENKDNIPVTALLIEDHSCKNIVIPDTINYISCYDSDVCFYVNYGSYAWEYAKANNIPYKYIELNDEAYFRYSYRDGKVSVVDYMGTETSITIPDKMYGSNITGVIFNHNNEATGLNNIRTITVPENVDTFELGYLASLEKIRGYKGSAAERYVKEHYPIKFEVISDQGYVLKRLRYAEYDDHVEIISCEPDHVNKTYDIPSRINDKPVTRILSGAFNYVNDTDYYINIPKNVEYISDDAFVDKSHKIIKSDNGSYSINYAKSNSIKYEETGDPYDSLDYCYSVETDESGNEYAVVGYIHPSFIDAGIIRIPEQIDGITVEKINLSFCYDRSPYFKSIVIPSSVKDINIRCYRESNSNDYSYDGAYSATVEIPVAELISEIRGAPNSYAEEYAYYNNIKFVVDEEYKYNTTYLYSGNYDYNYNGNTISVSCDRNVVHATIPERIGNTTVRKAYFNGKNLKSVTYLNSSISISESDFHDCNNLEVIRGYSNSTAEAYAYNHGIKFVRIYNHHRYYDDCPPELTFNDSRLQKCDISAVDVMIPNYCYSQKDEYVETYGQTSSSVYTNINSDAFRGCTALRSITIPDSISYIPDTMFTDCINLKEIHGSSGSAAEAYAISHNINFIANQETPRYIGIERYNEHYSGNNSDQNYAYNAPTYDISIIGYDPETSKLVIPEVINGDSIKKIREYAFCDYYGAETVEIPEYIEVVERGAFCNSGVKNVVLPKNMEYVNNVYSYNNDYSYYNSQQNQCITVLNPNAVIADDVNCKLKGYFGSTSYEYAKEKNYPFEVILDENDPAPEYLEYEIIYKDENSDYYYSEDNLAYMNSFAEPYIRITNCGNVEEVEIPAAIGGIPVKECTENAFDSCASMTKITVKADINLNIPNQIIRNLKSISGYLGSSAMNIARDNEIVFNDLNNPIEFPEGIKFYVSDGTVGIRSVTYDGYASENTWTTWNVPYTMYGLPITSVDFPFYTLTEIILPESVTSINLKNCPNVETIKIQNSDCKFEGNEALKDIYAPADNSFALQYAADKGITFHDINSDTVYSKPSDLKINIKDGTVIIMGYSNKDYNDELIIPESIYGMPVVEIADMAFYGYEHIKKVEIPESVLRIGYDAFSSCKYLEKIVIKGDPEFNVNPYYPYPNPEDVRICDSNVIIQSDLNENIVLYALKYGNHLCDMNGDLYEYPEYLKYYYYEDHVMIIGITDEAEEYVIPESIYGIPVTEICNYAFYNDNVKLVVIPQSVNKIGESAFADNTVIWGYSESVAETYAADHELEFVNIDITEQNWDHIEWHWENFDKDGTVTAELKSYDEETFSKMLNAFVRIESSVDATCTDDGLVNYVAEVLIDGNLYTDELTEILNSTGHSYYVDEWIWSDDHSECSAVFKCSACDAATSPQTANVRLEKVVDPTCTEDGFNTFIADIIYEGRDYSDTVTVSTNATGHHYVIDNWNWSSERTTCEVILKCSECSDIQKKTADISHEELGPTCTTDGYDNYIAEIELDGMIYNQRNDKVIPATGHSNVVDKWIWSDDHTSCKAELKCNVCNEITGRIDATVTHDYLAPTCTESGYDNYIANVTIDDNEYSDSKNNTIPANGHDLYADSWTWSDDHTQCNVAIKCHNCDMVINDDKVNISSETTKEPTYDEIGSIVYTGIYVYEDITFTTTEIVEIPEKERTDISTAKVLISATSFNYDGNEKRVNVNSVKLNGVLLTEGVDYEVTGNTATESGDYMLTITGIGAYKGSIAKYWKIVKRFTVSYIQNGVRRSYIYTENAFCNVEAIPVDGKLFSHWKLSNSDTILSYSESYTFRVVSDISVESVYVNADEPVNRAPVVAITNVRAFNNRIYYEITRDIPENYTVISNGILYGTSVSVFVESDDESRDNNLRFTDDVGSTEVKEKVHAGTSGVNTNKGYYSYYLNIGENTDKTVYLRGYVMVKDSEENIMTYYTDIVGKSYDQIINN